MSLYMNYSVYYYSKIYFDEVAWMYFLMRDCVICIRHCSFFLDLKVTEVEIISILFSMYEYNYDNINELYVQDTSFMR